MLRKLVTFACLLMAVSSVPLPAGFNSEEPSLSELRNYTVLYDGPTGKHIQFGEPGKAVRGFYTFFDSRGKKQKVTYEADDRGYRVKATAAVEETNQGSNTFHQTGVSTTTRTTRPTRPTTPLATTTHRQHSKLVGAGLPILPPKIEIETIDESKPVRKGSGKIQFKAAKTVSSDLYNLGYPFVQGNYIYAL